MSFSEIIDEGLVDVFKKIGRMQSAKNARAYENLKHILWAYLGDASAAGKLELNQTETRLYQLFAQFIGRMQYGKTARAFLDFVQAMKGQESASLETVIAAMKGTPRLNLAAPDSRAIKLIFGKIIRNTLKPEQVDKAVATILEYSKQDANLKLIYEYMRLLSQKNVKLLDQPQYAKLIPLLDRELTSSELQKMMLDLATAIMRSRSVAELSGQDSASPDGKSGKEKVGPDGKPMDDNPEDDSVDIKDHKTGTRIPKSIYIENLNRLTFEEEMHRAIREHAVDKPYWNQMPAHILSQFKTAKRINFVAANVISMMLAYNVEAPRMVDFLYKGEQLQNLRKITHAEIEQLRLDALRGRNPKEIAEQFNALYTTDSEASRWLTNILLVENMYWLKHNSKPAEDGGQDANN